MDGQTTPAESCAVVSGRVLDAAGVPVPGARVVALEEGPRYLTFVNPIPCIASARADREGRFRLEVSAGPALLAARVEGADALGRGPAGDAHARRVVLHPGDALADVELRLPHALAELGTVEGRVLDEDGTALGGRRVRVEGGTPEGPRAFAEALTDGDGAFRCAGLLPGRMEVLVRGDSARAPLRTTLDLPPGGSLRQELTQRRRPRRGTHRLDIRCEDAEGHPLEGVEVLLQDFEEFEERCRTGPGGEVRFEGLPDRLREEQLWASVEVPGWEPVEAATSAGPFEEHQERLLLRLDRETSREPRTHGPNPGSRRAIPGAPPPEPDAPLSGTVLDPDGTVVPGAEVYWAPVMGGAGPLRRLLSRKAKQPAGPVEMHGLGGTDADGGFRIRGLPPGPCLLAASLSRGAMEPTMEGATPLDLPAGRGAAGVVLRIPERMGDIAVLECRVVNDLGVPRDGVRTWVDGPGPCYREGLTDAFGFVEIRAWPGRTVVRAKGDGIVGDAEEVLEVRPGDRRSVVLRMQRRSPARTFALRVRVVDAEGRPVPGAMVRIQGEEGGGRFHQTGADGVLDRPEVPVDFRRSSPRVSAFAPGYRTPGPRECVRFPEMPPEGRMEATVVLHRTARVRLRVVDEGTGAPVPGLNVEVRQKGARGSSAGGRFTGGLATGFAPEAFDLEPGKAVLRAHAPGYEPGELSIEIRGPDDAPDLEMRLRRIRG